MALVRYYESFDVGAGSPAGYDLTHTETIDVGGVVDQDYAAPAALPQGGAQVLRLVNATAGRAYADHTLAAPQNDTYFVVPLWFVDFSALTVDGDTADIVTVYDAAGVNILLYARLQNVGGTIRLLVFDFGNATPQLLKLPPVNTNQLYVLELRVDTTNDLYGAKFDGDAEATRAITDVTRQTAKAEVLRLGNWGTGATAKTSETLIPSWASGDDGYIGPMLPYARRHHG